MKEPKKRHKNREREFVGLVSKATYHQTLRNLSEGYRKSSETAMNLILKAIIQEIYSF